MELTQIADYRPPTCLIVEDSDFDREKLTRVIQKTRGAMRIEIAGNLDAARKALARGKAALILLDNNLPKHWARPALGKLISAFPQWQSRSPRERMIWPWRPIRLMRKNSRRGTQGPPFSGMVRIGKLLG